MIKWLKICTLIIIVNLNTANNAVANNLLVVDNRFTAGAQAADYGQCAVFWGIYLATRITARIACMAGCIGAAMLAGGSGSAICPPTCTFVAQASAWAAMYGAYTGAEDWAEGIRKDTKVVNTIDAEKQTCGDVSGNLDNEDNFPSSAWKDDDDRWRKTGALANYCYTDKFNHHIKGNATSTEDIYNNGDGKIGISYKGKEPVWIEPGDCDTIDTTSYEGLIGKSRHFCAWTEGDEICAEAVFCTGLIFGDLLPIHGFVGDPTRVPSDARRKCGDDPYTDGIIDDFSNNNRCECFCCSGSDSSNLCKRLSDSRTCKTFNERYNAHCIKKAIVEEDFEPPIMPPKTVSYHCSMDVLSGYKEFSFVGKTVRCFSKTISNIYFGKEDVPMLDSNGKVLQDVNGNPQYVSRCIDNAEDDEGCTKSLYRNVQKRVAGILAIVLTLWVFFTGIRFLLVGGMSKGDFTKYMLQLGVVIYFVNGSGWKDGYYDFLMYGGYELSSGYFEATLDNANVDTLSSITSTVSSGPGHDPIEENVGNCSFIDINVGSEEAFETLQNCNFFNGFDPSGSAYSKGDSHLAVLDSLDCRFSKYLGFDRNNYFPEIIKVATVILFDTPSGFMFFIAAMAFLICSILLLLKVAFMFIGITIMISFLIYISPLIIPLMLFQRTKKTFDKWLGLLIGYSLQPFLILALIALIVLLIDGFFITYLQPLYQVAGVEYKDVGLGVVAPSMSTEYDASAVVSNMIKFLFLLVVIVHVFNKFESILNALTGDKFGSILNALTGAGEVSSFIKPPNFEGAMKKGAKKLGGVAKSAGKYATTKARQGVNALMDQGEEDKKEEDKGEDNKGEEGKGGEETNNKNDGEKSDKKETE